ncbi:MAG: hypothetical protein APF81_11250 [Desulfosporosinus sp. BRH_c37]|nr:MAG: hypothetical protein APF81_11250 [Desulfosporosinus sp. BRH_c37]
MIELNAIEQGKSIVVVGGGVAGMEAAIIAAQRGHKVVLLERSNDLGGQALLAAQPPHKEEINSLINYLVTQMKKQGVLVKFGIEVNRSVLEKLKPDEIIMATGAVPLSLDVPGLSPKRAILAWDVLKGLATIGEKVLIIGGGQVGCETAEYLLQQGKRVTILEMEDKIAREMSSINRQLLSQRLTNLGVDILTLAKLVEVDQDKVIVDQLGVKLTFSGFESIIIAIGAQSYNPVGNDVGNIQVHVIGDCRKPARLMDAIHDGFYVGSNI